MWRLQAVVLSVLLSCVGCSAEYFRAETELKSDGQVTRVICQPTLREDQRPGWDVRFVEFNDELESEDRSLDQMKLKVVKPPNPRKDDGRNRYILARGEFPSVDKIATHYQRSVDDKGPAAKLQPRLERHNFVFVTEQVWEETLTDIVRLDDIPAARRELVELIVPLFLKVLRHELGNAHDLTAVNDWLRDEGAKWFEELVWLYVDLSIRHGCHWPLEGEAKQLAESRLNEINRRHGLTGLEQEDLRKFMTETLRRLVKTKEGKPLSDELIAKVLRATKLEELADENVPDPIERVIVEEFGSEEAFQKRLAAFVVRIVGVHHPLQAPQQFDFRLKVPGFIAETNGKLLPGCQVHWRFTATEAYPFGHVMRCRSLEPNTVEQEAAFGKVVIATPEGCQKFVSLVKSSSDWLEPLRECVEQKSRKPLIDLRNQVQEDDDGVKQQFGELFKLLMPAPNDSDPKR